MDIERESAGADLIDSETRKDLETKILDVLSQMSTEDIRRLIEEMEASLLPR